MAEEEAAALSTADKKAKPQKVSCWNRQSLQKLVQKSMHQSLLFGWCPRAAWMKSIWSMSLTDCVSQVTRFELEQQKEREKREAAAKAQQGSNSRETDVEQYNKLLDGRNANAEDGVDAHNVDEALAQLNVSECAFLPEWLPRPLIICLATVDGSYHAVVSHQTPCTALCKFR